METAYSPVTAVVKSADRVLDMLEMLGCAARPLALFEVAQDLGIPKSSALALLRTLSARGYVLRDDHDRYALAHPFGREEGDWLGGMPRQVAAVARPIMEQLVEHTRETVHLGAMVSGFMIRRLVQIASPQEIRYEPAGDDCPAYCTAMGRILLAHAPAETVDRCLSLPLLRLTPTTLTDPAPIRALITQARREGFAEIQGEFAEEGSGVAAPVFDRTGRAVAALNLATLAARYDRHRASFIAAVTEAADTITMRLGGSPTARRS